MPLQRPQTGGRPLGCRAAAPLDPELEDLDGVVLEVEALASQAGEINDHIRPLARREREVRDADCGRQKALIAAALQKRLLV